MPADPKLSHVATQWPHTSPFIACRFDPLGRFIFASAEDNSIQRFEVASGKKTSLAAHDSWVNGCAFSKDGETMVSGGCDGRLIWWPTSVEAPAPVRKINAHAGWIRALSASPDGSLLATGGNDNKVKLWNLADGSLVREFVGHEGHVYSVLFHPSGQFVLSGDLKGKVCQWETATGNLVRTFDAKTLWSYNGGQQVDFGGVRALAVSPDGKHLACGGLYKAENPLGAVHEPLVLRFEGDSQKLVQSHVAEGLKGVVWRTMFLPDGQLLAVSGGGSGGFVSFWSADQPKEIHRFQLPNIARDLDLHPDGIQLATTHHDKHVRLSRMAAKAG